MRSQTLVRDRLSQLTLLTALLWSGIASTIGLGQTQQHAAVQTVFDTSKQASATTRWAGMTDQRLEELLSQMTLKEG